MSIFAVMTKGRDKVLMEARDQRMFERYYYWTEVKRLRFDDAIRKLSEEEFFVSESRVLQVVRRMIREGATVEGRTIERPMFTGFRVTTTRPRKVETKSAQRPSVRQLSLFDD